MNFDGMKINSAIFYDDDGNEVIKFDGINNKFSLEVFFEDEYAIGGKNNQRLHSLTKDKSLKCVTYPEEVIIVQQMTRPETESIVENSNLKSDLEIFEPIDRIVKNNPFLN